MKAAPIEKIISVDDLRRNFGAIKKALSYATFIVTDRGKQIAILSATPQMKRERMRKTAGAWKGSALDSDALWTDALAKKSRAQDISL